MSDRQITELRLDTTNRQALALVLSYDERMDVARMLLRAEQESLRLEFIYSCFGRDLLEFADSLKNLHASLEGEAVLDLLRVKIAIRAVDPSRGRLGVEVRLMQEFTGDPSAIAHRTIILDGFEIEQTYVPGIVREIRQFISESGISTDYPQIVDAKNESQRQEQS